MNGGKRKKACDGEHERNIAGTYVYYVNLKLQVEIENNNDFEIKLLQITSFR